MKARAGARVRDVLHGKVPEEPTPKSPARGTTDSTTTTACRSSVEQERVQRHTVEQIIETFVPVQILDDPVPLMVDQLVEDHRLLGIAVSEQVTDVPKIFCPPRPLRASLVTTQEAEQLVEAHARVARPGMRQGCSWPCLVPGCRASRHAAGGSTGG